MDQTTHGAIVAFLWGIADDVLRDLTSAFTLRDLQARAGRRRLEADFEAYLDGFSPNVQDVLEHFEFRHQIPRFSKADALGALIEKFLSREVNLSPDPVRSADG